MVLTRYLTPNTDTWMQSPRISLAGSIGGQLSFSAVYDLADDYVSIETSNDALNWTPIGYIYATSSGVTVPYALPVDDSTNLYFRFHLVSNESLQGTGISISDISITRVSDLLDGQTGSY